MKVSAVQCRIGDFKSAERLAKIAVEKDAEIILFPEYFSYDRFSLEITDITLKFLKNFSKDYGVAVCGNVVIEDNGLKNRAYIFKNGELIGYQDKIHPTRIERSYGISRGNKLEVFEVNNAKICILICADILYPEICRIAGLKFVDIALNPVVSFKYSELPGKDYRYCLYFTRSFENCYAIVKASGIGTTFSGSEAVGRSLISTFDGIIAKSEDENTEDVLVAEIDLDRIKKYREVNYTLYDRNLDAYCELFELR